MKKILLSILFLIVSFPSFSQYYWFIDFESPDSLITIDSSTGNLWQIGSPDKDFFNDAYSGSHAIVTDTLKHYPINNSSSFIIKFPVPVYPGEACLLYFYSKSDCDSLKDGIILSVSTDSGLTWYNSAIPEEFAFVVTNLTVDTPSSSGKFDWNYNSIFLCSANSTLNIQFRFTFLSDSIDNPRDGFQIDDIEFQLAICEGIQEINTNNHFSGVFPNPVINTSFLQIKNQNSLISQVDFYDALGRKISTLSHPHQSNIPINKEKFGEGIFFYRVELSNHKTDSGTFVVVR